MQVAGRSTTKDPGFESEDVKMFQNQNKDETMVIKESADHACWCLTSSHLNTEVKQNWALIVLGLETSSAYRGRDFCLYGTSSQVTLKMKPENGVKLRPMFFKKIDHAYQMRFLFIYSFPVYIILN